MGKRTDERPKDLIRIRRMTMKTTEKYNEFLNTVCHDENSGQRMAEIAKMSYDDGINALKGWAAEHDMVLTDADLQVDMDGEEIDSSEMELITGGSHAGAAIDSTFEDIKTFLEDSKTVLHMIFSKAGLAG